MYGTPERIKSCNRLCNRFPRRLTKRLVMKYKAGIAQGRPATRPSGTIRKKGTSGLGELDSTTMTAAGIGVVLVAGLLWVGSSKKRR